MKFKIYRHIAYNSTTGEVLSASTGNALKRKVEREKRWNIAHGYPSGSWTFSHNGKVPKACYKKRV